MKMPWNRSKKPAPNPPETKSKEGWDKFVNGVKDDLAEAQAAIDKAAKRKGR